MKSTCMSCKYFRIEDALSGYCRARTKESGKNTDAKPMVSHDDNCTEWADCGQQYYIRLGWVKAFNDGKSKNGAH